ncbi:methylated-DNA--[protein]-cysteine S-methyltransferase [Ferrovum myxofaciens]|jgi:AraC family transcriptional regulator of adaptative response/methylated-DNA-[protein]-cysteine methyltransferase|uniref:methylated-DNA--[protein]-cysteine S-methyltransferase n=1 Tax=Ferrovum myxofaciens TaxID=416213 RepID=A0A8F3DWF9_9PROT|nr:methylated-DNA--[protein]-cysteine S-methyltransferase [Ferrovum myxofaciens]MBW8028353.1 methylated-DNA--[protein]-cysteine S-methyltransferase [Ferrovum sp.]KXW59198.1 methylated-DNA--protein-cysteine methyltransferase, inducible [Ferrovum myxofaciens]MBU6994817.1 methylated-DNA--[protein]-cysteine S-methyltransferase [Ferrovum myxofaciens]QKE38652.1 MAG: methylated-DNA--[protein]-cysteine S-methyltransferase [Ferrovum myxofaciens]QKE41193.1 MAG: methylated-DNA--[protein]-cysteine S-methy
MNRLQQTSCSLGCLSWVFDIDGVRWLTLTGTPEAGYRQAATRFSALGGKVDLQVQEVWEEALLAAVECPTVVRQPIPLHLSGTGFQRAVWDALCTIPVGQWRTYGDIAALIGRPRAVRAVGSACGANPLPFLIPCHRVVASGGRWGGFGLGLDVKEVLLFREGMIPGTSGQISAHGRIPFL